MKNLGLILLSFAILSGCSTTPKESDSIIITGTRIDRSEIKSPMTAKISGELFKLYFADTGGDFSKIYELVMSDIGAPIPSKNTSIDTVFQMMSNTNGKLVDKSESEISLLFYSTRKDRQIKVTYLFENQQYRSYSIE